MSRLEEWCSNLFRIFDLYSKPGDPARVDTAEWEKRKSGDSGRSGGTGDGTKIVTSKTAPSPFSDTGGGAGF